MKTEIPKPTANPIPKIGKSPPSHSSMKINPKEANPMQILVPQFPIPPPLRRQPA